MKAYSRACGEHGCTLMEDGESCPVGHFVSSWLIVEDGIVVAEADEERVRWLRKGKLDEALCHKLDGRDKDGCGGRAYGIDATQMRQDQNRRDAGRRRRERERCVKAGRPVPEWARQQRGPQFEEADASFMRSRRYKAQRMVSEEAEA